MLIYYIEKVGLLTDGDTSKSHDSPTTSKWRYIHGQSSDFTHTPPLSARGPTQIADRQSLWMPSTWSMTVSDLGVRPRRLHLSVFTTICARHNSPSRLLPRSVAFRSVSHSLRCSSLRSSFAPVALSLHCSVALSVFAPSLFRSIHSSLHNYSFFCFLFPYLSLSLGPCGRRSEKRRSDRWTERRSKERRSDKSVY